MGYFDDIPSRQEVRELLCPACGALPTEPCIGARDKPRESNHQERVNAWKQRRKQRRLAWKASK